jgi:hypothetical protein
MEPVRRNTLGYEVSTRANVTSEQWQCRLNVHRPQCVLSGNEAQRWMDRFFGEPLPTCDRLLNLPHRLLEGCSGGSQQHDSTSQQIHELQVPRN